MEDKTFTEEEAKDLVYLALNELESMEEKARRLCTSIWNEEVKEELNQDINEWFEKL